MPRIFKTANAKEDLINIWSYTYKNWGERQADHYHDNLEKACQLLAETPLMCRLREELSSPVRIHHHEHHLIIYIQVDEDIHLIRVLHESMDYERHLTEGNA